FNEITHFSLIKVSKYFKRKYTDFDSVQNLKKYF
ncbi:MAG: hypothetical protein ACI9GZ_003642, partial [Bacteroidia bacterium]